MHLTGMICVGCLKAHFLPRPMVRCPDTLEEFEKLGKDVKCIDHDGWDCWTYFVLVAEV